MPAISWLLSLLLFSANATTPTLNVREQPSAPMIASGSGVNSATLPDAQLEGFVLKDIRFAMGASVNHSATATFSGTLQSTGSAREVRVRAGVVRAASPVGGVTPWVWQSSRVFTCTDTAPMDVELGVGVPEMLPAGLARNAYALRMQLERLAAQVAGAITLPASAQSRLGLLLEDVRVTLTRPGTLQNEAVFSGRLLQKGLETRVALRAGFMRAASEPWDAGWFLEQRQDFTAPARERSLDFTIRMDAPPLVHVGVQRGAYIPGVEVVGPGEPAPEAPVADAAVLSVSEGLSLVHWEYRLTADGQPSNTAVFSGTLENTGKQPVGVTIRAGFQPLQPMLVEGRVRDVSYWPWKGETRLPALAPGKPTPFTVEFPAPPQMELYLRIPSYKPAILLLRAP